MDATCRFETCDFMKGSFEYEIELVNANEVIFRRGAEIMSQRWTHTQDQESCRLGAVTTIFDGQRMGCCVLYFRTGVFVSSRSIDVAFSLNEDYVISLLSLVTC